MGPSARHRASTGTAHSWDEGVMSLTEPQFTFLLAGVTFGGTAILAIWLKIRADRARKNDPNCN